MFKLPWFGKRSHKMPLFLDTWLASQNPSDPSWFEVGSAMGGCVAYLQGGLSTQIDRFGVPEMTDSLRIDLIVESMTFAICVTQTLGLRTGKPYSDAFMDYVRGVSLTGVLDLFFLESSFESREMAKEASSKTLKSLQKGISSAGPFYTVATVVAGTDGDSESIYEGTLVGILRERISDRLSIGTSTLIEDWNSIFIATVNGALRRSKLAETADAVKFAH